MIGYLLSLFPQDVLTPTHGAYHERRVGADFTSPRIRRCFPCADVTRIATDYLRHRASGRAILDACYRCELNHVEGSLRRVFKLKIRSKVWP